MVLALWEKVATSSRYAADSDLSNSVLLRLGNCDNLSPVNVNSSIGNADTSDFLL